MIEATRMCTGNPAVVSRSRTRGAECTFRPSAQ